MLNKHSSLYRIITILIVFGLLGVAVFVPLAMPENRNDIVLLVVGIVYAVALIATIVVTEVYWRRKRKNK